MSIIIRSQEIYKKLPRTKGSKHTLVPIRGLYVAGEHRPPWYINFPGVTISGITSTRTRSFKLTSTSASTPADPTVKLLTFRSTNKLGVTCLTRKTESISDPTVKLLTFRTKGPVKVDKFTRASASVSDPTVKLLTFRSMNNISVDKLKRKYKDFNKEHMITLKSIESKRATVTVVVYD